LKTSSKDYPQKIGKISKDYPFGMGPDGGHSPDKRRENKYNIYTSQKVILQSKLNR